MEKDIFELRSSVRKFTDEEVPENDIREMLEAAIKAPSGKNIQNWHFVVVTNKRHINAAADIITEKNKKLRAAAKNDEIKSNLKKYLKFTTHFKNAPVLVLFFVSDYPVTGEEIMKEAGASKEEIDALLKASPGIQNIAAAAENFMLKAAELGYGTCWMTSQNYASLELQSYFDIDKEKYNLALITPLGVPAEEVKSPPRKSLNEVVSWVW
jgi:nitroreductase